VSDPGSSWGELERLIDEAIEPPPRGPSAFPRATLRKLLLRFGRARALHEQQIDRKAVQVIRELERDQRVALEQVRAELSEARAALTALREELGSQRGWLQTTSDRGDNAVGGLAALRADQERDRQALAEQLSRIARSVPAVVALDGSEAFTLERFDAGLGGEVIGFRGAAADEQGRVYVGYENFFRGSEALIRERQKAYLPLLVGRDPVLDVGCGRGEMLELLREHAVEAKGIDVDPAMVEHSRAKGLLVEAAEAAGYLEGVAESSLGAVFAAQVIEHLPYPDLLRFLRAARTALRPGGLLIVETVNPHSPQALKHFWLDPTHQHPLFPETVIALARLTGFAGAFVWHPQGRNDPDRDRLEQMDYAVVAESPLAPT